MPINLGLSQSKDSGQVLLKNPKPSDLSQEDLLSPLSAKKGRASRNFLRGLSGDNFRASKDRIKLNDTHRSMTKVQEDNEDEDDISDLQTKKSKVKNEKVKRRFEDYVQNSKLPQAVKYQEIKKGISTL